MIVNFLAAGPGHVDWAEDGDTVSHSLPARCSLRMSTDMQDWTLVSRPASFVHTGPAAHYRIDCDTYSGTPVQAVLTINTQE